MPIAPIARKKTAQPGTIKAHGFEGIPEGYLLCDGCIVNRNDYPKLFEAIGYSWGNAGGTDPDLFNLPDLRGKFLRGVDKDGNGVESVEANDPDRADRTPNNSGGNTGNNVGTDQDDKTRIPRDIAFTTNVGNSAHRHTFRTGYGGAGNDNDRSWEPYQTGENNETLPGSAVNNTHSHTITSGGDVETRPVNSSVVFVIKT